MPIPTNLDALTAIDLGTTLPVATSQDVHDAGTTYAVWYAYTAQPGDHVIGLWGFGDVVTYMPSVKVYLGPAAAPVQYLDGFNTENKRIQIPVTPGTTYYFEFTPNGGDPTPAILTIGARRAPKLTMSEGSIFVNDDSPGYPAVILDPDTGDVRNFVNPFPNGEAGDVLVDGTILVEDADLTRLQVYDKDFNNLATLDIASGSPRIRANRFAGRFYVGRQANPVTVVTVTNGALDVPEFTLTGITSLLALAAANDDSVLYHANTATGAAIRQWDLLGASALADLAPGIATYFVPDILVLADNSIIALFVKQFSGETLARHYAPDGTQLNEYAIAPDGSNLPFGTLPRLAYAVADPTSFWVWWHPLDEFFDPTEISRFQEIQGSDGTVLRSVDSTEYELGIYGPPVTATPIDDFGNSFSCPFFILMGNPLLPVIGPLVWVEWPRVIPDEAS